MRAFNIYRAEKSFAHAVLFIVMGFVAAFPLRVRAEHQPVIKIQKSEISVIFVPDPSDELKQLAQQWISNSAHAVASYYGQFPVKHVEVRVRLREGRRIGSGETFGWKEPTIKISVGRSCTLANFSNDWEMTHEMTHLAFPSVAREHHWIEEGLATYVEPIARARVGDLTTEKVWGDMMNGMSQGLPESGDRGLDFTHTWGRTYWGGALFCLVADIEIRQRTKNTKGLEDALRGIVKAGGTITQEWELNRALEIGDRAVRASVLRDMYDKWKAAPVSVDLDALWKDLGVVRTGKEIRFDDSAPLASIRRAITAPPKPR